MITLKALPSFDALMSALVDTLRADLIGPAGNRAVVLAGGSTPYLAYDAIAQNPPTVAEGLHLTLSDERLVAMDSEQNNFHNAQNLFDALGLPEEQTLPVFTELPRDAAAARLEADVRFWIRDGVSFPLCLLGLGPDGHTAGLFNDAHLMDAKGRFAIGVERPDGRDGVSFTPEFFRKIDRIIIIAPGASKRDRVADLVRDPLSITAGKVVKGCEHVELWVDPDSAP